MYTPPVATTDQTILRGIWTGIGPEGCPSGWFERRACRERDQAWSFRGSKSRNKVSVGEPAEGSLPYRGTLRRARSQRLVAPATKVRQGETGSSRETPASPHPSRLPHLWAGRAKSRLRGSVPTRVDRADRRSEGEGLLALYPRPARSGLLRVGGPLSPAGERARRSSPCEDLVGPTLKSPAPCSHQ